MSDLAPQIARRASQFVSLLEQMEVNYRARGTDPESFLILDEYPVHASRKQALFAPDNGSDSARNQLVNGSITAVSQPVRTGP